MQLTAASTEMRKKGRFFMRKICIVGAGTMGWSIAQVFAANGCQVALCDRELAFAQKGKEAMAEFLSKGVARNKMTQEAADATLGNVEPGIIEAAAGSEMAIEAIYENMQAKQDVFRQLEEIMPADAIFASNTSSLSITEIASKLKDPSRLVGMHFFNPASVMELVELIAGAYTSEETVEKAAVIAKEIGKTPVRVEESAGFVVNRILIPMINESICVLAEGVASAEDIDTAMRLGANHRLGPLALGDMIGLDILLEIMKVLMDDTGDDKYRPHPLLKKMVRAGKLGKKTGEGFFVYDK